jgi:hypothetical protein
LLGHAHQGIADCGRSDGLGAHVEYAGVIALAGDCQTHALHSGFCHYAPEIHTS